MQSTSYIPGYQLTPYSLHILTACVHYMSQQYLIVHILPVSMGPRYFMIANKLVSYIYNTIILQDHVVTLRCDQQINCFFSNFCKTKHYYNYILYLSLFNSRFRLIYNSNYHLNLSNKVKYGKLLILLIIFHRNLCDPEGNGNLKINNDLESLATRKTTSKQFIIEHTPINTARWSQLVF